jgi:hypothetical protein
MQKMHAAGNFQKFSSMAVVIGRALKSLLILTLSCFVTHTLFIRSFFKFPESDPWQVAISEFTSCLKRGEDCRNRVISDFASVHNIPEDVSRLQTVLEVFWTSVGSEVERLVQRADQQQKRTLEYIGKLNPTSNAKSSSWADILKEIAGSLTLPDGTAIEKKKGVLEVLLSSPSGPQLTFQL